MQRAPANRAGATAAREGAGTPATTGLHGLRVGPYVLELVTGEARLDEVLELRFAVFNEELGEGLEASEATGRDRDLFDAQCRHLAVRDARDGVVVGTYRLQSAATAAAGRGFYSADEFALEELPDEVLPRSMELGRACIHREHRNRMVLFLLWRGLATLALETGCRYLFGCCSLTSQDPMEGLHAAATLDRLGYRHADLWISVRPGLECSLPPGSELPSGDYRLPRLFRTYLRYGARVASPPAVDQAFRTIDFLVVLDLEALEPGVRRLFLSGA